MTDRASLPATLLAPATVRMERLLPGPVERLWAYLTESKKRATWFCGGEFELRVGGHARLQFDAAGDWRTFAAFVLAGYALVVYPLLAPMLGRDMAEGASFGLPCPVTIFTLGMLGLARRPFPRSVFVVPVLWALIGVQAAWLFGAYEDLGLAVAALAALWFALPARWERTAA